jgi:hypothetical protein
MGDNRALRLRLEVFDSSGISEIECRVDIFEARRLV